MSDMLSDHDRLIKIHEKLDNLTLQTQKIVQDHEKRIRSNEKSLAEERGAREALKRSARIYGSIGAVATAFIGWMSLNK